MLTLEQMKDLLKDRRLRMVANQSGVSYYLVRKIAGGKDVPYSAAKRISDYLAA